MLGMKVNATVSNPEERSSGISGCSSRGDLGEQMWKQRAVRGEAEGWGDTGRLRRCLRGFPKTFL